MASGLLDILPSIAPLLKTSWAITSPATSLGDVRIMGSNDATYGTVGWPPRLDGVPFVILKPLQFKDDPTKETNRIWTTYDLSVTVAIEHADTPSTSANYYALALAWAESGRQLIAANRRIGSSLSLFPTAGDVQWWVESGRMEQREILLGTPYWCMQLMTRIKLVISVNYQP